MNKFLLLFLFFGIQFGFSQNLNKKCIPENEETVINNLRTGIIEIGDFTITDTDGNTLNLYQTLGEDKTVFLDLFYTTCEWCQYYAPVIEQIYQNTGAGKGDIVIWGINPYNSNADIIEYKANYGITIPCAGIEGGGDVAKDIVIEGENFQGYPTYFVICPDKTVFFDHCYPPRLNGFNPYFEASAQSVLNAGFIASKTNICETKIVNFTDNSTGNIISWKWTFPGGSPSFSSEQNPSIAYNTAGTYNVIHTVSDGSNSNTMTKKEYITVNQLSTVTMEPFDKVYIYDPPFELTGGNPVGGIYTGSGVSNGYFDPVTAWIGSHTITYTYIDLNNCEYIVQQNICVNECTEINENTDKLNFDVFPNPSSGEFKIELISNKNIFFNIEIIDMLGVSIFEELNIEVNGKYVRNFNFNNLTEGVYFIMIQYDLNLYVRKLKILR
ncbi:MAG: PKD domain-containing protein [Bacteroidales bacterium]|nr:PKD domain-containing protein [Bacteroidales bacterium]